VGYGFGNRIAVGRRTITAQAQAEQVIWKVAIFGAGTATSNGEYVWDGTTLYNGKPVYSKDSNTISWDEFSSGIFEWGIYDDSPVFISYASDDLISWSNEGLDGAEPAPSSALSYAQDSFISSLTLTGANESTSNGAYFRETLNENFLNESGNSINFDILTYGGWALFDLIADGETYTSPDLFTWSVYTYGSAPAPTISSITYSA
jgi:hypothetical protein